jgi:acyl carrier protein
MAEVENIKAHTAVTAVIREILDVHGRLAVDVNALTDQTNLYEAGLTSHGSVNLMLAIEERFDVEFPDRMMQRGSFATIAAIRANVEQLVRDPA